MPGWTSLNAMMAAVAIHSQSGGEVLYAEPARNSILKSTRVHIRKHAHQVATYGRRQCPRLLWMRSNGSDLDRQISAVHVVRMSTERDGALSLRAVGT